MHERNAESHDWGFVFCDRRVKHVIVSISQCVEMEYWIQEKYVMMEIQQTETDVIMIVRKVTFHDVEME